MTRRARASRVAGIGVALALQACTNAPRASVAPAAADPCAVAEGPLSPDTLSFALPGAVDPAHAPIPATGAERVVFRSIYETLVRVDCRGTVRPGLAARWRSEDGGRRWVFELRDGAVFSDGLPVTADAVAASWRADVARRPLAWGDSGGTTIAVRDERTLAVSFDRPHAGMPRVLADPSLAVARPSAEGGAWPPGSGPYVVVETRAGRIVAAPGTAMLRDALPVLSFATGNADPRDLIDAGVDLVLTRDRAVAAYAAATGSPRVIALPWDLAYVLAVRGEAGDSVRFGTVTVDDDLTAAAGGSEARAPEPPYWWRDAAACGLPRAEDSGDADRPREPRVAYSRDDPTARGLAERLVALAASGRLPAAVLPGGGASGLVASGLDRTEYEESLRAGTAVGYVLALDRQVLDGCAASRRLAATVPWAVRLIPLLDTRPVLVARRVAGTLVLDWDGTPFLEARP